MTSRVVFLLILWLLLASAAFVAVPLLLGIGPWRARVKRSLPIRGWLALALIALFAVPALTGLTLVQLVRYSNVELPAKNGPIQDAITRHVSQWSDPAWQATLTRQIDAQGAAVVLLDADGNVVYRSAADPVALPSGQKPAESFTRLVRELHVRDAVGRAATAQVYFPVTDSGAGLSGWQQVLRDFAPVISLGALALTIAAVAWLVGPALLRPLAAMSQAARQVARGNLDVQVPDSRVREVAEVATAFGAMGDELRSSLYRQAELEQERRLFIGAIAHDLRTPLFSLRGYLQGLEQGLASTPEKAQHYIRVCQEKAEALERLVEDLFAYTRLEYLEQVPHREPLELGALLLKIAEGLRPQAEVKDVALVLDEPTEPLPFEGDAGLLTRALENLLDNALRYTPAGGRVRLSWCNTLGRAQFTVADTGPGIAPQDLPHLFEPLYRGEASRNRRTGGAGLGLTIARRILLAHGGDLSAANGPSGGACFTGWLPVAQAVGSRQSAVVGSGASGR